MPPSIGIQVGGQHAGFGPPGPGGSGWENKSGLKNRTDPKKRIMEIFFISSKTEIAEIIF